MTRPSVRTDVGEEGPGSWVDQAGRVDGAAAVFLADSKPILPTYRSAFSFAAVSGDALVIFGRAGIVLRIAEIVIAKPTAQQTVLIIKRETADSGGTSTLLTPAAMDPDANRSNTAVRVYTVAPTTGTALATIDRVVVTSSDVVTFDYTSNQVQQPTLRHDNDCLAINVDATGTLIGSIAWTEEVV